ncbi:MAG: IPT/TIG domain-containing protein [Sideroxyarcus sp.]|nr:IPT/TIG domain-containing protein [Sideroxyarcus sp.]
MYIVTKVARLFAFVILFALSACGGGGGDGGAGGAVLSVSTNNLTFSASNTYSSTPAPQTVVASLSGGSGVVYMSVFGSGAAIESTNFTITGDTTGEASISVRAPSTLGVGTYTGTVTVEGCTDVNCTSQITGSPQTINVTYTVAGITAAPAAVDFSVGEGQTPSAKNVTLTAASGSQAWTSSITYDSGTSGWLSVPASGASLPATVAFNASSMPAGIYRAHVTFNSTNGSTQVVPVALNVSSSGVTFVSPYVGTTNVSNDVIIRGWGFTGATQVQFGATPASAFSVVNDSEVHATYPALAAGTYPVTVDTLPTRANLVVVDAPAFSYAAINRTANAKALHNLIYDAERKAVYLLDVDWMGGTDRIERYRFSAGSWTSDTPISFGGSLNLNTGIALSPDGTEIVKANYYQMGHISTATFTTTANISAVPDLGIPTLSSISMANDGSIIGNATNQDGWEGYYRYDVLNRAFFKTSTPAGFINPINRHTIARSADGSRILIMPLPLSSAPNYWYYYRSSDSTFVATALQTLNIYGRLSSVSVSRNGSRSIIDNVVYDDSFSALGTLLPSWNDSDVVIISPEGANAYIYIKNTGVVHKYDLTSAIGGVFAEVGTGTAVPDAPGDGILMAISPDGGSLIIAGTERVIVMAAP